MQRTVRFWLTALIVGTGLVVTSWLAADAPATRTLNGNYVWEEGEEAGTVKAIFTPTGEGHWNVAFHFTFQGQDHIYSGTADGKLDQGPFAGRVQTDQGRGVFTFKGEFKDGRFQGNHARLSGGNEEKTGTLTLGG